ncbi:MAG: nicotinate-nucleotide--dimethylbenzimidazole phosphoribosyltransferase [Flavobacteriales bacterium]
MVFYDQALQNKLDNKTKPKGSLGQLESLAFKIGSVQNTTTPELKNPHIIVFAGDNGIVNEGVSAFPQEVTYQMVMNFLKGGAAISVLCKQNDIDLKIVDAGVAYDFDATEGLVDAKLGHGTKNFLLEPAMTKKQVSEGIEKGGKLVKEVSENGCNVIGFGEMGIGNTSPAALLMHFTTGVPIVDCVGKGTGLSIEEYDHKLNILNKVAEKYNDQTNPYDILSCVGSFEIVEMVGGFLQAAKSGMVVMVDGFIASAAFSVAYQINPNVDECAVFCHCSEEKGHWKLLDYFKAKPLLDMNMRLGEGTGCALAYPILNSATAILNEMASFDDAGVSNKEEKTPV